LNIWYLEEEIQITNKHMKKFSMYLATKAMQVKTILRFDLILVRLVIMKKRTRNAVKDVGKRNPHTLLIRM
jgi:hypothetical protein